MRANPPDLRVSFNGRTSASQAENEGSIPFTRSNSLAILWVSFGPIPGVAGSLRHAGRRLVNNYPFSTSENHHKSRGLPAVLFG